MSIWMKWAVPSVLEVFSATFVLNRWIWLFRQSVIFFKNFKILSDFDAPAKKYFIFYDKIPFRPRPTFSVPFRLNFSPNRWPYSAQNWPILGLESILRRKHSYRQGWFTAYLANVFLTKLQGPILSRRSRDSINTNHAS